MEVNKIIQGECLNELKKFKDNSVDICITSPPYNVGKTVRGNLYKEYSDNLTQTEYKLFISNVLKELIRVTKHYVFFNFQVLSNNKLAYLDIFSEFKDNIKEIIIWHKKQVQPAIQPTCLSSAFEFIVVFCKKELAEKRTFERANFNNRLKGELNTNVIYGNNMSATKEFNSEQGSNKAVFPQYLVRWFLEKFSKEGDIILDPFSVTGTTALVSKQMNRKYIGIELSKEYYEISKNKLKQNSLF